MKRFITATDLFNFAKCPHRPFMDFFADPQQKSFVHPLVQLLWHSGVQYEAKVIESFQKQFPHQKFIEMDPKQDLTEDLFLQTQEAMRAGYNFILYGALISENLAARPNFLIKMKGQSHWGDYHYVPMDIKMARVESSWDDGNEKLPKEQLWLLYFYADLLEKVQGVRPLYGSIYKTKSRQLRVYFNKPNEGYSTALQKLLDLHHSKPTDSRPVFSSNCKMCEWKSVCKDWIVQHNDCTQVYYVGSAMQQGLAQLNIHTPEDLAAQDPEILKPQIHVLKSKGYFWKTLPDELIEKSILRAKMLKSDRAQIHSPIEFPSSEFEIHYDLEDDPTQDFVYLHGLVLAQKGKEPVYHSFFAESIAEEKQITEALFEFLKQYPDAPIYHYSPYEQTTLKRLLSKYPSLDPERYFKIFSASGTSIDLLKIINDKTDWPLSSYSIKDICRFLGFQWDASDASGASSIVWMNDYLNGNKDLKSKILRYNQDDCMASYFLKQSLIQLQEKGGRGGSSEK